MYNFYRDDPNSSTENDIHYSIKDSKSFDYKTSLIGKLEGNNTELQNIKIPVRLKYLVKLFGLLQIPLINCEVSLYLKWSKNCELQAKLQQKQTLMQILQLLASTIQQMQNLESLSKITSLSRKQQEEQPEKIQEEEEFIIPPERRQQIIDVVLNTIM